MMSSRYSQLAAANNNNENYPYSPYLFGSRGSIKIRVTATRAIDARYNAAIGI